MPSSMNENVATIIPGGCAVYDGFVRVLIVKLGSWVTANIDRHQLHTGVTVSPFGQLTLDIPVEGVKEGDSLNKDQISELLKATFEVALPNCEVFTEQAQIDFKEDF